MEKKERDRKINLLEPSLQKVVIKYPVLYKQISFNDITLREAVKKWNDNIKNALIMYGPIEYWNVTDVKFMDMLFADCDFNHDISNWERNSNCVINGSTTRNVVNMSGMFMNNHHFNKPLNINTSSVTDMRYMFNCASRFNQTLKFDTINVTNMEKMFFFK